jgi:hypothetical protein
MSFLAVQSEQKAWNWSPNFEERRQPKVQDFNDVEVIPGNDQLYHASVFKYLRARYPASTKVFIQVIVLWS